MVTAIKKPKDPSNFLDDIFKEKGEFSFKELKEGLVDFFGGDPLSTKRYLYKQIINHFKENKAPVGGWDRDKVESVLDRYKKGVRERHKTAEKTRKVSNKNYSRGGGVRPASY